MAPLRRVSSHLSRVQHSVGCQTNPYQMMQGVKVCKILETALNITHPSSLEGSKSCPWWSPTRSRRRHSWRLLKIGPMQMKKIEHKIFLASHLKEFETCSTWAAASKSQSQLKCSSLLLTRRCSSGAGVLYLAVRVHHLLHCNCSATVFTNSFRSVAWSLIIDQSRPMYYEYNIVPWHCCLWLYLSERNHRSSWGPGTPFTITSVSLPPPPPPPDWICWQ